MCDFGRTHNISQAGSGACIMQCARREVPGLRRPPAVGAMCSITVMSQSQRFSIPLSPRASSSPPPLTLRGRRRSSVTAVNTPLRRPRPLAPQDGALADSSKRSELALVTLPKLVSSPKTLKGRKRCFDVAVFP